MNSIELAMGTQWSVFIEIKLTKILYWRAYLVLFSLSVCRSVGRSVCICWLCVTCAKGQNEWNVKDALICAWVQKKSQHQRSSTHRGQRNVLGHEFMIIDHDTDFKLIFLHIFLCIHGSCVYVLLFPCFALLCFISACCFGLLNLRCMPFYPPHLQIFQSVHLKENFYKANSGIILFCSLLLLMLLLLPPQPLPLLSFLLLLLLFFSLKNLWLKSFLRSCILFCVWYFHTNCFNHTHTHIHKSEWII